MPQLSLTDFVDIVSSGGTPKATKVRQIKYRPPYNPATDFYKPLRESIIDFHRHKYGKSYIDTTINGLSDPKKQTAYPMIAEGYKKWIGKKKLIWFDPPRSFFSSHGVDVTVNPELGLIINGTPHLIKLYFKADKLTKNRIDIITHLMTVVLFGEIPNPQETVMSVLDIRNSKLISPTIDIAQLNGILKAELSYIATLWDEL